MGEDRRMDWIEEADGVFRGGGVKGIGLAGALCGFAEHPTKPVRRWVNVAGASAGAIIACYLALDHSAQDMAKLLRETPFASFQDFPRGSKALGVLSLLKGGGMAAGNAFESWFDDVLDHAKFDRVEVKQNGSQPDWRLKLIAVDITNRRLLVLPDDLGKYREPGAARPIEPNDFKISRAARMSMSIPYFFEPIVLEDAETGKPARIVDGGTLSNFPVWLFDVDPDTAGRPPTRPTFGFTLTGGRGVGGGLAGVPLPPAVKMGFDIFHTAQSAWDDRFVSHSTRVRTLAVDADGVGTTDFDLTKDQQDLLMKNGREAADKFLETFRLEDYLNTFHQRLVPATTG
jgi:NTE family protein